MDQENFYTIMGLEPGASDSEIREAYRNLARIFHPDSDHEEASEEQFRKLSEAYTVLSDPKKKKIYDFKNNFKHKSANSLDLSKTQTETIGPGTLNGEKSGNFSGEYATTDRKYFRERDKYERDGLLGKFGGKILGSSESSGSSKGSSSRNQEERFYQFTLDALESMKGCEREVAVNVAEKIVKIPVRVPAGISHGAILRVTAPSNDPRLRSTTLKVKIIVNDHHVIKRDGKDVIFRVPISIGEAINGCTLELPSLDGSVKINVPPQSKTLKMLRLKGKGAPGDDGENGDMLVDLFLVLPDKIDETVRAAVNSIEPSYLRNIRKGIPKSF